MHVFPPDIKNISVSRNREIVLQTRDKTLLIHLGFFLEDR